jgi:hypothetical protein
MKRLIFWEFPRASWQYDVVVALILAFIFLTPRSVFKDQPRPSSIVQMTSEQGALVYWLETDLLAGIADSDRPRRSAELIFNRTGKRLNVSRVEPLIDAENEIKGYIAIAKP